MCSYAYWINIKVIRKSRRQQLESLSGRYRDERWNRNRMKPKLCHFLQTQKKATSRRCKPNTLSGPNNPCRDSVTDNKRFKDVVISAMHSFDRKSSWLRPSVVSRGINCQRYSYGELCVELLSLFLLPLKVHLAQWVWVLSCFFSYIPFYARFSFFPPV